MKRRQHTVRHAWARCLPVLTGMACCLLLWSGAHLPARQAFAHQSFLSVHTVSTAPASADHAAIGSAESGRPSGLGDPWVDFTGANEDSLEEKNLSDAPVVPVYLAEDAEASSATSPGAVIPSRPGRSASLYCLFEVYRL